jgi:hypothetical protein
MMAFAHNAIAQKKQTHTLSLRPKSYIYPFPQTRHYNVYVFGDGLAEGLAGGLEQAFEKAGSVPVKIIKATQYGKGLARSPGKNWGAEIDGLTQTEPMHIVVIMLGLSDIRNMRVAHRKWVRWNTPEWRAAYGKEIDRLIKALKERKVAVYWVGLPVMPEYKTNEAVNVLNDIYRKHTYINQAKFVDTLNGFTDQTGRFILYGPDITGKNKRLRAPDGSFTTSGYRKLANYVEILLRRDLREASVERNIPLAGDEAEQHRIIPKTAKKKTASKKEGTDTEDSTKSEENQWIPGTQIDDQKTDNKKTNTESAFTSSEKMKTPLGETIYGDMDTNVTSLATLSPIADLNAIIDKGEQRLPLKERLYYKTLVKGEALKAKPGRADDFSWPRNGEISNLNQ